MYVYICSEGQIYRYLDACVHVCTYVNIHVCMHCPIYTSET